MIIANVYHDNSDYFNELKQQSTLVELFDDEQRALDDERKVTLAPGPKYRAFWIRLQVN